MHEYEIRLTIHHHDNFISVLNEIAQQRALTKSVVYYAPPDFRYRDGCLEQKRLVSAEAVYFDGLWFKWVHSVEKSFQQWSSTTHQNFLKLADVQDAFKLQVRTKITLDHQAQVYTFKNDDGLYRIVFEWEYGIFSKPLQTHKPQEWFSNLSKYKDVYDKLKPYESLQNDYILKENMIRKPVECISTYPELNEHVLVAHKWDGIFGLVISYADCIKETWEGYRRKLYNGMTLGNGIVFAAEKLDKDRVVLLDVYQVRGLKTASWCRKNILTEFLPSLNLPSGYYIQRYESRMEKLPKVMVKTDGYIFHNTYEDKIYKVKDKHSIDVLYNDGYFWLMPIQKRFKCLDNLSKMKNGCIYEISVDTGRVVRIRSDRFTGNTLEQIEKILSICPEWKGSPLEDVPNVKLETKRRRY